MENKFAAKSQAHAAYRIKLKHLIHKFPDCAGENLDLPTYRLERLARNLAPARFKELEITGEARKAFDAEMVA